MYERMLGKNVIPTREELSTYCGENRERFIDLNQYLIKQIGTEENIRFPYGNKYGWCITHREKRNIFALFLQRMGRLLLC